MGSFKYLLTGVLFLCSIFLRAQIDWTKDYHLTKVSGKEKLTGHGVTVVVFYAPQCPVCLAETKTLANLKDSFGTKGVTITLIYPGTFYSKVFLRRFQRKYGLSFTAYIDKTKTLTAAFNATTTPQAFVLDGKGQIAYSGKIDNLYEAVGKRRQVITETYLANAIQQVLLGQPVAVPSTDPVGCLIN